MDNNATFRAVALVSTFYMCMDMVRVVMRDPSWYTALTLTGTTAVLATVVWMALDDLWDNRKDKRHGK